MTEALTLSTEAVTEPTTLTAQEIGRFPVSGGCANANGCTEAVGICASGCMAEFASQPEPQAFAEPVPGLASPLPQ